MLRRIGRLFTIKTRFEAFAVIYAIALGAVMRGAAYLEEYPGTIGWIFFAACVSVVFIAGDSILHSVKAKARTKAPLGPSGTGVPARLPTNGVLAELKLENEKSAGPQPIREP